LVADAVLRSWQRCQRTGRPAAEPLVFEPVEPQALARLLERQRTLLAAAQPHLQALAQDLASAGYAVMLTDAQGRVLQVAGLLASAGKVFRAAFRPGVNLSEEAIGTSAMTTAIAEQAPCYVRGAEHFFAATHSLHCCAAPVFNPQGEVVGAVDVSREQPGHVPGALALTHRCARLIAQALWAQLQAPVRLSLLEEPAGQAACLAFALDGQLLAADRQACALLDLPAAAASQGLYFQDLFADRFSPLLTRMRRGGGPLNLSLHGGVRLRAQLGASAWGGSRAAGAALHTPSPPLSPNLPGTPSMASTPWQGQLHSAQRAYEAGLPLLIQGETGTGKEHTARWLHQHSSRHCGPFVALNCAALSPQLMAAELFGHAEGAFTGARRGGQAGHVEAANAGTLLLDEIGDMPLDVQVALLRVLDRAEVTRLGETRPRAVDVRIMCATHQDVAALVAQGRFRADLYYRLRGCLVPLTPLREREDFDALLTELAEQAGALPEQLPAPLRQQLRAQAWPGNVRQLRQALCLALALAPAGAALRLEDFQLTQSSAATAPLHPTRPVPPLGQEHGAHQVPRAERIRQALAQSGGNMTQAARLLGIGRATLYRWLGQAH